MHDMKPIDIRKIRQYYQDRIKKQREKSDMELGLIVVFYVLTIALLWYYLLKY